MYETAARLLQSRQMELHENQALKHNWSCDWDVFWGGEYLVTMTDDTTRNGILKRTDDIGRSEILDRRTTGTRSN